MWLKINFAKLFNSLSGRLTLSYSLSYLGFMLLTLGTLYFSVNSTLANRIEEDLFEDIHEFRQLVELGGAVRLLEELNLEAKSSGGDAFFYRLFNTKGQLIAASDLQLWQDLKPLKYWRDNLKLGDNQTQFAVVELAEIDYPVSYLVGYLDDQTLLQFGETEEEKAQVMEVILAVVMLMLALTIPLVLLVGWQLAKQISSGIEAVGAAADEIKSGHFDSRVNLTKGVTELNILTTKFNAMALKISHLLTEMRELTDNIAHDLRSPLARIRVIAESAIISQGSIEDYHHAATDTIGECDRLLRLINTTLDVAEAEAGLIKSDRQRFSLPELIEDIRELFEPLAEQKNITLTAHLPPVCEFEGHLSSVQRMLANLIDNSLKYTPDGGKVTLTLIGEADGIRIIIADTGIGIPMAEQQRVFERFYRSDQSRHQEGCGLGLSYSYAVAKAHGGDITLQSELEKYTRLTVSFPL